MPKTRIAAVSSDGRHIDQHFGQAERFLIYDLNDTLSFVEERPSETLSVGDREHAFDPHKFNRITGKLIDCSRIYTTQIGTIPAAKLKEMGIEPVIFQGRIDKIVL